MSITFVERMLSSINAKYFRNYPLSKISWFKIGGNAEILYMPQSISELLSVLAKLEASIDITIIGNCSNLLVRDGGISGLVIKPSFREIHFERNGNDDTLYAEAGVANMNFVRYCQNLSISQTEFLSGIPGSIGGSIYMNAGCYGYEISNILKSIEVTNLLGEIRRIDVKDINFEYRKSLLPKELIILGGRFSVTYDTRENIDKHIENIFQKRQASQPISSHTAGSSFKNPADHTAWKLIDACGLRGYRIGSAQISELHTNFIVTQPFGLAKDVEDLINHMQKSVYDKFGIEMEPEIQIIGKDGK